jgi:type II secretory pathway component GspD/PulD (secretin)
MNQRLAVFFLVCALAAGAPSVTQAQRSNEPVTLNFVNADIEAVARTMAAIIGRNIVVDPRVKGTINLSTERPVPPSVAYNQFLATLRLSGFTVVDAAGLLKVVPEADAKLQGGAVSVGPPVAGNQIVTQIFRLNYEPAANLVPILRPLISPNNTINVNPGNNSLVITDYADNLQRLGRIISALDVSNATDVEVIPLRHALAAAGAGGPAAAGATSTAPAIATAAGAAGTTAATAPTQPSAQPSTGGQIQADPATNSLIITAAEPQYRQLRAVIDRLDSRRAQVYVESLIAEVNADKVAEFGIQWQNVLGNKGDKNIGVLGTNFTAGGANILNIQQGIASGTPSLPTTGVTGINLGLLRNVNGVYMLAALARFLETNADGNTLSTPNLLTLDNEEAKIVIGQNVPFVTGQFTNASTGTAGTVNPFQTIERKDVGLTLRIRPQISENGTVKMQIFQEVSSVDPASINSVTGLITNKRSIESSVLVDDGSIVVLGGLLQDDYGGSQDKVPGLGDIPIFGALFKSERRQRKKTNLMVFLRPIVVRDAAQSDALSLDRYDLMRGKEMAAQPASSLVVPINAGPILPVPLRLLEPAAVPAPAPAPAAVPTPVPPPAAVPAPLGQ